MILATVACVWGKIAGVPVVVDRHSTFRLDKPKSLAPRNLLFQLLHHFTLKNADLTIVTNEHLADLTRDHGGRAFVLQDPLPRLGDHPPVPLGGGFNVVMPCSFAADEPVEEVIEAMRMVAGEGITLHVTGNPSRRGPMEDVPDTVRFTGFLPLDDYEQLILSADAVMVLTKARYAMLCGCYEAVAAGKPLITSNTPVLRDYFEPAVFVETEVSSIAEGLRKARREVRELKAGVQAFRTAIGPRWEEEKARLQEHVLKLG
jgi:glycosyltransferase involved in cell wall biosynthesis